MKRSFSTVVCIVALLFAQWSALTHATWHALPDESKRQAHAARAHDHPQVGAHGESQSSGQAALCVFHLAFGAVLGAVHSGGALLPVMSTGIEAIPDIPASRLHAEALSPKSRGPPVLF